MEPISPSDRNLGETLAAILDRFPLRRDIIVFAPSIGWDPPFLFQRPQQLARAFARAGCVVFYAEPEYEGRRPDGFHEVEDGLFVSCVPLSVFAALESPLVVVLPYNTQSLRYFKEPRVLYEFLDNLELWGGGPALERTHRETIARAAAVTATARNLLSLVSPWRPDALYSPNAADFSHFAPRKAPRLIPEDLAALLETGVPVIGYTGALAKWFDYQLVRTAAESLPGALFVLVGTDHDGSLAESRLLELPNVRWLGQKPYEILPAYVETFDVAMIPFVVNEVTASTSPVKLFEYFAAEKPVVATALPECLATPLVRCSHSAEEFVRLLGEGLERKRDEEFRAAASALAQEQTWDRRAADILSAISHPAETTSPDWRLSETLASLSRAEAEVTRLTEKHANLEKEHFARIAEYESAVQEFIRLANAREEVIQAFARQAEDREKVIESLQGHSEEQRIALESLGEKVETLSRSLDERERTLQQMAADYERHAREQERTIQHLTISLNTITSSRGWRAVQKFWDIRLALAPQGSTRERALFKALRLLGLGKDSVPSPTALPAPAPPPEPSAIPGEPSQVETPASPAPSVDGTSIPPVLPATEAPRSEGRRQPVKMQKPRVAYLTNQLLDWFTKEPRFGGGERYAITLAELLKDHGFDVTFFQAAGSAFEGEYYGNPVVGIPLGASYSEFQHGVCDAFHEVAKRYDYVIHNLPEYASGRVWQDSILICHGIWFDHDNYGPPITFRTPEWYRNLNLAFSQPGHVVSVDTNSINVIRCLWPELTKKMTYIPNWVDVDRFHPAPGQEDSKTVLFPRRSQVNRGSRILADILKAVPHQDWRFRWVGEGDAVDTQLIKDLTLKDSRLEYHSASFEEMAGHYQSADICVIPTIACEGTSLSCLEALASGNAVISTNVGGLPDLVQPGINGLLVDPNAEAIAGAINFFIENPEERARLRKRAAESAEHFRLEVWRDRWTALLGRVGWLSERSGRPA